MENPRKLDGRYATANDRIQRMRNLYTDARKDTAKDDQHQAEEIPHEVRERRLESLRQRKSTKYAMEWLERLTPEHRAFKKEKVTETRKKINHDNKPRKFRSKFNHQDINRNDAQNNMFRIKEEHIELLSVDKMTEKRHFDHKRKRNDIELCHPLLHPLLRQQSNTGNEIRMGEMSREAVVIYRRNAHRRVHDWKNYQIEQFAYGKTKFGVMVDPKKKRSSSETREKSHLKQMCVTRSRRSKFRYEPVKLGRSVSIEFKNFDEIREMFHPRESECSRNDDAIWKSNPFRSAEFKLNLFKEMKKERNRQKYDGAVSQKDSRSNETFNSCVSNETNDRIQEEVKSIPCIENQKLEEPNKVEVDQIPECNNSPPKEEISKPPTLCQLKDLLKELAGENREIENGEQQKCDFNSQAFLLKVLAKNLRGMCELERLMYLLKTTLNDYDFLLNPEDRISMDKPMKFISEEKQLALQMPVIAYPASNLKPGESIKSVERSKSQLKSGDKSKSKSKSVISWKSEPINSKTIVEHPPGSKSQRKYRTPQKISSKEESSKQTKMLGPYDVKHIASRLKKTSRESIRKAAKLIYGDMNSVSSMDSLLTESSRKVCVNEIEARHCRRVPNVIVKMSPIAKTRQKPRGMIVAPAYEKSERRKNSGLEMASSSTRTMSSISRISRLKERTRPKSKRKHMSSERSVRSENSKPKKKGTVTEKRITRLESKLKELLKRIGVCPWEEGKDKSCVKSRGSSESTLKKKGKTDFCVCPKAKKALLHFCDSSSVKKQKNLRGCSSEPESAVRSDRDSKPIIVKTSGSEIQLNLGMEITMENFDPVTGEKLYPEENRDFEQEGNILCKLVKPGEKPVTFLETDFLYNPKTGMLFKDTQRSEVSSKKTTSLRSEYEFPTDEKLNYAVNRTEYYSDAYDDDDSTDDRRSSDRHRGTSDDSSRSVGGDPYRLAIDRQEMKNRRLLRYSRKNSNAPPKNRKNQTVQRKERISMRTEFKEPERVKFANANALERSFYVKEVAHSRIVGTAAERLKCNTFYEKQSRPPSARTISEKGTQVNLGVKKKDQCESTRRSTGVQAEMRSREKSAIRSGDGVSHRRGVNAVVQTESVECFVKRKHSADVSLQTPVMSQELEKYLKDLETQKRVNLAIAELCFHLSNNGEVAGRV